MGQPGRDGSASLGKQTENRGVVTLTVYEQSTLSVSFKHVRAAVIGDDVAFDLTVPVPASTPSEDLASGDPMGMNKTGTLGPADKDRRSKKKSVSKKLCCFLLFHFQRHFNIYLSQQA